MSIGHISLEAIPSLGSQRNLVLSRKELALVLKALQINRVNRLSPLLYMCQVETTETPRSANEVLNHIPGLDISNAKENLFPLIAPDRIIDVSVALFGQAPRNMRIYSSRKAIHMIAVTMNSQGELVVTFPLFFDLIYAWLESNFQFSGKLSHRAPFDSFNAEQISFLIALIDAYKGNLFGSYAKHHELSPETGIFPEHIFNMDNNGHQIPDRRFLVSALDEIFTSQIHVGGATQIGLPHLDPVFIKQELSRYQKAGLITENAGQKNFVLSKSLSAMAADLSQWINLVSLHDIQVNEASSTKIAALEEVVCFIGTQTTIWSLVSEGLTKTRGSLNGVEFGFRSGSIFSLQPLIKSFLQPISNFSIDSSFYQGTVPVGPVKPERQPSPSVPKPAVPNYCRFCGKPSLSNTKFCRYCGKPLQG